VRYDPLISLEDSLRVLIEHRCTPLGVQPASCQAKHDPRLAGRAIARLPRGGSRNAHA